MTFKKVLNEGYVKLIETWGSDERIVEAARMSTGKGFLGWGPKEDGSPGDEKLLRFLWEHKHATPFEMGGMIVEVQAPIMVFREWHRHRTQSYNEMSARYIQMPNLHFIPSPERVRKQDAKNKQGTGSEPLPEHVVSEWLVRMEEEQNRIYFNYQWALENGIPKELARINTPISRYSRMRASANLRNWLAFLTLRNDSAAQEEIRVYAEVVQTLLSEAFPRTLSLFTEGKKK